MLSEPQKYLKYQPTAYSTSVNFSYVGYILVLKDRGLDKRTKS